jgi:hypothetical protein
MPDILKLMPDIIDTNFKPDQSRSGKSESIGHSELSQAGFQWMGLLADLEAQKRKKKKESSLPQKAKDTAAALREKMTQTFSQRRRKEQHEAGQGEEEDEDKEEEEETESEEGEKESTRVKSKKRKNEGSAVAFTSSRRTTDRVLSGLKEENQAMLRGIKALEKGRQEVEDQREKRRLDMEGKKAKANEEKWSLLREWLQAQQQLGERLPSRGRLKEETSRNNILTPRNVSFEK